MLLQYTTKQCGSIKILSTVILCPNHPAEYFCIDTPQHLHLQIGRFPSLKSGIEWYTASLA